MKKYKKTKQLLEVIGTLILITVCPELVKNIVVIVVSNKIVKYL